jgi:hypothetical protein
VLGESSKKATATVETTCQVYFVPANLSSFDGCGVQSASAPLYVSQSDPALDLQTPISDPQTCARASQPLYEWGTAGAALAPTSGGHGAMVAS